MPDGNDKNERDWLKTTLKAIGIGLVILLALIVVGFGLLVGICTFGARC